MTIESDLTPYDVVDLTGHRVLVLAPHPDDESFGCGAALALHCQQGDPVRVVFLSSGELGQWGEEQDLETTRNQREKEVHGALALLGVDDFDFWRYPDRGIEADGELVARLEEALATFRSPDLWENEVAPISVIGTAGEGVDELEVGPGVRQLGGVELG